MAIAYLNSTESVALGAGGGATPAIDSTGASLIVVAVSHATNNGTLTDSAGNVWTLLHEHTQTAIRVSWYYCTNPAISATHTFSYVGTNVYPTIGVTTYTASSTVVFDTKIVASGSGVTSQAPGSVTPANSNSLVVSVETHEIALAQTVTESLSIRINSIWATGVVPPGLAMGDTVQTTATAINPSWSDAASTVKDRIAAQAVFYESDPAVAVNLTSTIKGLGVSGGTSDAINSVGADLIVVSVARYVGGTPNALVDSAGNTWTKIGLQAYGTSFEVEYWYTLSPSTSVTHTFTETGSSVYNIMAVAAYVGPGIVYESQSMYSPNVNALSIQPGSLTPTNDNSLIVTVHGSDFSGTQLIDSGFTIRQDVGRALGSYYGHAIADLVQTTAAAVNPTWSSAANGPRIAGQVVFYIPVVIVPRTPLIIDTGVIQQLQSPDMLDGYTTNAADLTPDNAIVRADGGVNGVQASTALIADTGALTLVQDATLETSGDHSPVLSVVDSTGSTWLEFNAQTLALGNLGIGTNCVPAITTGTFNFGFGANAGKLLANGHSNVLIGNAAGTDISSGSNNHCIGANAGGDITTGSSNVLFGLSAGRVITTTSNNAAIGYFSLATTTGTGNLGIGTSSGRSITTGSYNTFLGTSAGYNASQLATASSSIAIGVSAYTTKSNQVVIGSSGITETLLQGNIAIDNALVSPNWQSMNSGVFMRNVTTAPVGNPTGGGFLYVEAGALKFRGSGGTITTVAPA